MLAIHQPKAALTEEQAHTVAKAYVDMQRHYSPIVTAKTLDTLRFAGVFVTVYGKMVVEIVSDAKSKPRQQQRVVSKPNPLPPASPSFGTFDQSIVQATKPVQNTPGEAYDANGVSADMLFPSHLIN
jgi:hypothetical protein